MWTPYIGLFPKLELYTILYYIIQYAYYEFDLQCKFELNSCWNRTPVLMSEKRYQLHMSKRITSLTSNIYYVCVWIFMALQSRKSSRTVQFAIYVDQDNKKPAYIFFSFKYFLYIAFLDCSFKKHERPFYAIS